MIQYAFMLPSILHISIFHYRIFKKAIILQITFAIFFLLFSSGSAFAAPTVSSITESTFNSGALSHAVSMPATVTTGDLLLVIVTNNGDATVTTPNSQKSCFLFICW